MPVSSEVSSNGERGLLWLLVCYLDISDVLPTGRRQSKTLIQSTNANQKSLETVFYIAIYQMTIKTLFFIILDLRSAIV